MFLAVLREIGLAFGSLFASILVMTLLFFGIANAGLVNPDYAFVSLSLLFNALPFCIGLGAVVATVMRHLKGDRPLQSCFKLVLIVGLIFSTLMVYFTQSLLGNLFFIGPGFALWGYLSGLLARRRVAQGKGIAA